jgi:nucleoside 2-deoxyribosyltransferase
MYALIVDHLLASGHQVLTAHLARPEVMARERVVQPQEVFRRDVDWITKCDALVAEVTTPSHGVGYEIAYALGLGRPVLCCYQSGSPVSKMILGNDSPTLRVVDYRQGNDLRREIDSFLARCRPRAESPPDPEP